MSARQQETRKLLSIEKRGLQLLAVTLVASLWFRSGPVSFGLILGGGIALLNFYWLWRIMEKVVFEQKWLHNFQALIKFIVLAFAIFLVLRFTKVNPIAFIVGISVVLLGILLEVVRESLKSERKGTA